MAEMVLLKCEYCGGTLEPKEGDLWCCINCGTSTLLRQTVSGPNPACAGSDRGSAGFRISVGLDGEVSEFKVRESAEFDISFDRRATMADPDPINITLTVDGRPRRTYTGLSKTGTGKVCFEDDGGIVLAYAQGKAFLVRSGEKVFDVEGASGVYQVGDLGVTVIPSGE